MLLHLVTQPDQTMNAASFVLKMAEKPGAECSFATITPAPSIWRSIVIIQMCFMPHCGRLTAYPGRCRAAEKAAVFSNRLTVVRPGQRSPVTKDCRKALSAESAWLFLTLTQIASTQLSR